MANENQNATMRAAIYTRYGPPEVVQIKQVPMPVPGPNELLIRIHAATVNRTDCGFRSASYFISRFWTGLIKPQRQILGCEFSGEVVQVGSAVQQFAVGDRVFGYDDALLGGHAEYICMPETASIAHVPKALSFDQAAALTEGAHYALNDIRAAGVLAGQHVLVYGATGAIGSAAVQILKAMDVRVTAVCATTHIQLLKKLGADRVIDYLQEDYTQCGEQFDLVFDAVGKTSFGACKHVLKPKGIYISTELGKYGQNVWYGLFKFLMPGKHVLFPIPVHHQAMIKELADLADAGKFTPLIDRAYPLSDIRDAYHYVETGMKLGNVIIHCAS